TAANGIATFSGVTLTGTVGTNYVLRFTSSPALTSADSNNVTVTAGGTATKYLVTSSSYSPVAGGTVTITAQLADANNNAVSTAGKTVTWTKSNANGS